MLNRSVFSGALRSVDDPISRAGTLLVEENKKELGPGGVFCFAEGQVLLVLHGFFGC